MVGTENDRIPNNATGWSETRAEILDFPDVSPNGVSRYQDS